MISGTGPEDERIDMKYIDKLKDGMHVSDVYLCKQKTIALTKNGKEYGNLLLQDKTGQIESKIWDLHNPGIRDFDAMDYVYVEGNVTVFNNANQLNILRIQRAPEGSYDQSDYFPVSSKNIDDMYKELTGIIASVKELHLKQLLMSFFMDDKAFARRFKSHSAAKSVHHGFIGGLLEHTLSVTRLCDTAAKHYPFLNRDLLISGAMLHDIGKTRELSAFPQNDYTDAGQLLGHIIIGSQMVEEHMAAIDGFPERLHNELIHLILSHHGELEFGSPKKPALIEAMVLSMMDNLDAKVETMYEALSTKAPQNDSGFIGFNKLIDSNLRKTDGASY